MDQPPRSQAKTKTRIRKRALVVGAATATGLVVVAAVGLAIAYSQRGRIGAWAATRYLRDRGVPAQIRLDRLDAGGAAGSVILGAPGDPDLAVEGFEVRFGAWPALKNGLAMPPVKSVRLVRPSLKARYDGRRFTFGTLQPLVDQALAQRGGGPSPDLRIEQGRVRLDSPAGRLAIAGNADLQAGRIATADAHLSPADLQGYGAKAQGASAAVSLQAQPAGRLAAHVHASAAGVSTDAVRLAGLELNASADLPNDLGALARPQGPLRATGDLTAADFSGAGQDVRGLRTRISFDGAAQGPMDGLLLQGRGALALSATSSAGAATVTGFTLQLSSDHLRLQRVGSGALARTEVQAPVRAAVGGSRVQARLGGRAITLEGPTTSGAGGFHVGESLTVSFSGRASTRAGLAPFDARRIAALLPAQLASALGSPLEKALTSLDLSAPAYALDLQNRTLRLRLNAPAVARGGGAAVAVSPSAGDLLAMGPGVMSGAFSVAAQGDGFPKASAEISHYRLSLGTRDPAFDLAGRLQVEGDIGPVQAARLGVDGQVVGQAGAVRVSLTACANLSADRVGPGAQPLARAAAVQLCPTPGAPLLTLAAGGWRVRGALRQGSARLPDAQVAVRAREAVLDLQGRGPAISGAVGIAGAELADTTAAPRFRPLLASGRIGLQGGAARGDLQIALAAGARPLGTLKLVHDAASGAGQAVFSADALALAPDGLQPADIAPAAGQWLSQVSGNVRLAARITWSPLGLGVDGRIRTDGLDLRTPAGLLKGLRTDLTLASLTPLATEPDQEITAERLEAVVPLTALSARLSLTPAGLSLSQAGATLAGGQVSLDPLTIPLTSASSAPLPLTVRLKGLELGQLVGALNLSNALSIQARIDGVLPVSLGPAGVRLAQGRVYATGPGRLSLHREALTGAATAGGATTATATTGAGPAPVAAKAAAAVAAAVQTNAIQDFAYQALENLAFDALDATVDSRPQGRLGVVFHVIGRNDPPMAAPTRISLIDLLKGRAFDKPIPLPKGTPVDLTLDSSLNFDDLLAAYGRLNAPPAAGSAKVQP